MAYCVKCGKELRSGDKFCFCCGAKVPSLESETEDISRENRGLDELSKLAEQPISYYTGNTQNGTAAPVIRSEGLSLIQYFCKCYGHYADFSGKANRKELWGFALVSGLINSVLFLAGVLVGNYMDAYGGLTLFILSGLYSLINVIPSLAVSVRRLHDTGRSGAWIFISLIPFIGSIWLLVLFCTKGYIETRDYPASSAFKSQTIICIVLYIVLIIAGVLVYDYYDNMSRQTYDNHYVTESEKVVTTNSENRNKNVERSVKNERLTEGDDMINTLSSQKKRNLNVFLSNFSEAFLQYYDSDNIDADKMIGFAFTHNLINNESAIVWNNSESEMGISASQVSKTLKKYFGIDVAHQSTENWRYDGTCFWIDAASGEGYGFFSIADGLYNLNDGTYKVTFSRYTYGYGLEPVPNEIYRYTDNEAMDSELCTYDFSGTAIIKPTGDTWQLLYYEEFVFDQ